MKEDIIMETTNIQEMGITARDVGLYVSVSEQQILSYLLHNPDQYVKTIVEESSFVHEQAVTIFKAIGVVLTRQEEVNVYTVLREANILDTGIDLTAIEYLFSVPSDEATYTSALDILQKEKIRLNLLKQLATIESDLRKKQPHEIDTEQLVSQFIGLKDIVDTSNFSDKLYSTIDTCLDDYSVDLENRVSGAIHKFYDEFLDTHLTRKAEPGQIILISASTGIGKSIYALNLVNNFINTSTPCMYFTLEMDKMSTFDRLLARRLSLPVRYFYDHNFIPEIQEKVQKEKASLLDKPFYFIDKPNIKISQIELLIKEFKTKFNVDYVCVFVDLITQVEEFISTNNGVNLATAIEQGVNKLNKIAKDENVCFVCVAQMKRTVESVKVTQLRHVYQLKPTLSEIKNSGALAERSRVVLSLFRPKHYAKTYLADDPEVEAMPDVMEVNILKQNQGSTGVGKYLFNGETMAIDYIVEDADEEEELDA